MKTPLKVAIIGAGWVSLHRHVPAIRCQDEVEILGIIDRKPGRAALAAKAHKLPAHATSLEEARSSWFAAADAVAIATAPFTHAELALSCLDDGKHVITEKPFAINLAEGEAMVERANRCRRQLAVVHNFQFSRAFTRALNDLEQGKLGKLLAVEATQFSNPRRRLPEWYQELRGGLFFDESPHLLYLMKRLGGGEFKLLEAFATSDAERSQTPAQLTAFLEGSNGCPLRLSMNFVAPVSEWQIFLCGTEQLAVVDIFRDVYIRLPNDGEHVTSTVLRTSLSATLQHWCGSLRPGIAHVAGKALYGNEELYRRFFEACRTGVKPVGIGPEDGLAVLRMQHAILDHCRWS